MPALPDSSQSPANTSIESLSRAVRFGLASVVFGLSYPNIWFAFRIHDVAQIANEMLGERPLPAMTTFTVHAAPAFIGMSMVFPLIALGTLFIPGVRLIYLSSVLVIGVFVQLFFQWHALSEPLIAILQNLSNGPAGLK